MRFKIIKVPGDCGPEMIGRGYDTFGAAIIGWGKEALTALDKLEALPVGCRINDPEGGVWERIA